MVFNRRRNTREILDLKFAYATNGKEIIEFDFLTGIERTSKLSPRPTNCGRACGRRETH